MRHLFHDYRHLAFVALASAIVALGMANDRLAAQQPGYHQLFNSALPPGAAAQARLIRGGDVAGYFQPVELTADKGVRISLASQGAFTEPLPTPVTVGLLIGPVYRFRVTNIVGYEGREVFPTVELLDRLHPPAGAVARFPIPVELTDEDLRLALQGHFITRVVYLEDPQRAIPTQGKSGHPGWFDAGAGANPLVEADSLGRAMAILRLGGRLPDDRNGPDQAFLNGSPPLTLIERQPWSTPRDGELPHVPHNSAVQP